MVAAHRPACFRKNQFAILVQDDKLSEMVTKTTQVMDMMMPHSRSGDFIAS